MSGCSGPSEESGRDDARALVLQRADEIVRGVRAVDPGGTPEQLTTTLGTAYPELYVSNRETPLVLRFLVTDKGDVDTDGHTVRVGGCLQLRAAGTTWRASAVRCPAAVQDESHEVLDEEIDVLTGRRLSASGTRGSP